MRVRNNRILLTADDLAPMMAAFAHSPGVQLSQTRFRMSLVDSWGITEGQRVLEIGCGQGDTTLVLANAVGSTGSVLAVDIAESTYGAPATLGESAEAIKNSALGDRIEFRFGFNPLEAEFAASSFDAVVLAHCSWYFPSLEVLAELLAKVARWTSKLCLSDWDLMPRSLDALPHLLSVLIQGQVEAFKSGSVTNVRTPYSRETLFEILDRTGWTVSRESSIDSSDLDDGRWEIGACLNASMREIGALDVPDKFHKLIESQVQILRSLSQSGPVASLPSFSVVAKRANGQGENC